MSRLKLRRPIAFFDLETTGTDPREDRIVEISVLKVSPDGSREIKTRRIDPGVPIPAASTEIHGIRDEDVADEPTFAQVAKSLFAFLDDCDLAGYGIFRFDVPLLVAEFERVGMAFDIRDRAIVDALTISLNGALSGVSEFSDFFLICFRFRMTWGKLRFWHL